MTVVREVAITVKVIDQASDSLRRINGLVNGLPTRMNIIAGSTARFTTSVRELGSSAANTAGSVTRVNDAAGKTESAFNKATTSTGRATSATKAFTNENQQLVNKLRLTAGALDAMQMYQFGNTAYAMSFMVQSMNKMGKEMLSLRTYTDFATQGLRVAQFQTALLAMSASTAATKIPVAGALISSAFRAIGMYALGASLVTIAAFAAVSAAMVVGLPFAIQWQTQMANIAKTTGLSGTALESLSNSLLTVAGSSGVAQADIARMAFVAGQVGITGTANITAFTQAVADSAIAFDMSGDAAATYIAKLSNIYDIKPTEIHHMTSAITELGNTTAASEQEIMDYMLTLGNTMEMLGATSDEAAAFGTTLISLGIDASRSGTEMNSAMMFLMRPQNIGKLARLGGISKQELMTGDFDKNLLKVLKGIAAIEDPIKRNNVLVERFGFIGAKSMRTLVENVDDLERNLNNANRAFKEGTAAGAEAKKKRETFGAEWQNTINLLKQLFITLGEPLIPVATFLLRFINQLLRVLIVLAQVVALLASPLVYLGNILNWISNILGKIDILPKLMNLMGTNVAAAHNPISAVTESPRFKGTPSHAEGLNSVPFDNYMARLHKGEMILSARQASQLRYESQNFKGADQMLRDALHGTGTLYPVGDVVRGTATAAQPLGTSEDRANISFFKDIKVNTDKVVTDTTEIKWWMRIWYRLLEMVGTVLHWIHDQLRKIDAVLNHIPSEMLNALKELPKAIMHGILVGAEFVVSNIVGFLGMIYDAIAGILQYIPGASALGIKPRTEDQKIAGEKKLKDDFAKMHEWVNDLSWDKIKNWFSGNQTPAANGPTNPFEVTGPEAQQAYKITIDPTTFDFIKKNQAKFPYINLEDIGVSPIGTGIGSGTGGKALRNQRISIPAPKIDDFKTIAEYNKAMNEWVKLNQAMRYNTGSSWIPQITNDIDKSTTKATNNPVPNASTNQTNATITQVNNAAANGSTFKTPKLFEPAFKFDTGGVAKTPQVSLLGENGPEAVLPANLTAFLMNASTQPNSGPVSLTLQINNPTFRNEQDKNDLIRDVKREMVKFYDVLEKRDVRFTRQQVN